MHLAHFSCYHPRKRPPPRPFDKLANFVLVKQLPVFVLDNQDQDDEQGGLPPTENLGKGSITSVPLTVVSHFIIVGVRGGGQISLAVGDAVARKIAKQNRKKKKLFI